MGHVDKLLGALIDTLSRLLETAKDNAVIVHVFKGCLKDT